MQKKDTCIICLSDTGDIKTSHTQLACKCNVPVHTHCWMQYVKTKRGMLECPMCHVITLRNPILGASITGISQNLVVRVSTEEEQQQKELETQRRVATCFCGCLLSWVSTVTIAVLLG